MTTAIIGLFDPAKTASTVITGLEKQGGVLLCVEYHSQNPEKFIKLLRSNQAIQTKIANFSELKKLKEN